MLVLLSWFSSNPFARHLCKRAEYKVECAVHQLVFVRVNDSNLVLFLRQVVVFGSGLRKIVRNKWTIQERKRDRWREPGRIREREGGRKGIAYRCCSEAP